MLGTGMGSLMASCLVLSVGEKAMVAKSAIIAPDAPCDRTYLRVAAYVIHSIYLTSLGLAFNFTMLSSSMRH